MLTGVKDTDFIIMENLDDEALFNFCLTSKKGSQLCRDENFWRNRFIKKYGKEASKYKPAERSWKNHYLKVVVDLSKFSDKPEEFLKYIQWSDKGPEKSFFQNYKYIGRVSTEPFLDAPEWVMNNFYLLDLGEAYINGKYQEHVTPFMLFESEAKDLEPGMLINGRGYVYNNFWRFKHTYD